jgi:RimJ/RimL family protein N-acetyltransferase
MKLVSIPAGIRIRPARPEDAPSLDRMVDSRSQRSLYRRFLHVVSPVAASAELQREVQDREQHSAGFIAEDSHGHIVGEAYAAALEDDSVEVSFVVTDSWQHRGVGTLLREALFAGLRAVGVRLVYAEVDADNEAMLEFLRDAGLPLHEERLNARPLWVRIDLAEKKAV